MSRNLSELRDPPVLFTRTHRDGISSDDFLASGPAGVDVYGLDGQVRCGLPSEPGHSLDDHEDLALILGDEVVVITTKGHGSDIVEVLQTLDRGECKPIATASTTLSTYALIGARGVVLVIRADATGTYADGYRA